MNKRMLILTIFYCLCASLNLAAQTDTADTASIVQTPAQKCFLWKISSADNSLYLLGAIHVANQELYPLEPRIENAFAQASTLVVEADIVATGEQKARQLTMEKG